MEKIQTVRELLIHRYSRLKNVSVEKAKMKFKDMRIDDVIEKHYNSITFSIVLVVLMTLVLIVQFISLYRFKSTPPVLVINVLLLIIFLKGLRDNYEIKQILKILKEIGVQWLRTRNLKDFKESGIQVIIAEEKLISTVK